MRPCDFFEIFKMEPVHFKTHSWSICQSISFQQLFLIFHQNAADFAQKGSTPNMGCECGSMLSLTSLSFFLYCCVSQECSSFPMCCSYFWEAFRYSSWRLHWVSLWRLEASMCGTLHLFLKVCSLSLCIYFLSCYAILGCPLKHSIL